MPCPLVDLHHKQYKEKSHEEPLELIFAIDVEDGNFSADSHVKRGARQIAICAKQCVVRIPPLLSNKKLVK